MKLNKNKLKLKKFMKMIMNILFKLSQKISFSVLMDFLESLHLIHRMFIIV